MDLTIIVGYLSGLYFIKADLDTPTLLGTAALVHLLDAALCRLIASKAGRNRELWTIAGLLLGIWALATLFLMPRKKISSGASP